ncbi:MAG: hypothetical protein JXR29_03960 [Methylothermaceae bacterium]|nr:hypothetical protein [Methylothermaceae bacterium]
MLKTLVKISAVVVAMGVMTGCANNSKHMQEMHDRFAAIESRLSDVESAADAAMKEARSAHEHAYQAEEMAQKCHEECKAHGAKMDKLFQKSMMK